MLNRIPPVRPGAAILSATGRIDELEGQVGGHDHRALRGGCLGWSEIVELMILTGHRIGLIPAG